MQKLKKMGTDPEKKEQDVQTIKELIDQSGDFYSEAMPFLNDHNHLLVLNTLCEVKKSSLLGEELKFLDRSKDYTPIQKYSNEELLKTLIDKDQQVLLEPSSRKDEIKFIDTNLQFRIERLSESPRFDCQIDDTSFEELEEIGEKDVLVKIVAAEGTMKISFPPKVADKAEANWLRRNLDKVSSSLFMALASLTPKQQRLITMGAMIGVSLLSNHAFAGDHGGTDFTGLINAGDGHEQMKSLAADSHFLNHHETVAHLQHDLFERFKDFIGGDSSHLKISHREGQMVGIDHTAGIDHAYDHAKVVTYDFDVNLKHDNSHSCEIHVHLNFAKKQVETSLMKSDLGADCGGIFKEFGHEISKSVKKANYHI